MGSGGSHELAERSIESTVGDIEQLAERHLRDDDRCPERAE